MQFTTRTLLYAMAFVGIWIACALALSSIDAALSTFSPTGMTRLDLLRGYLLGAAFNSPLWVPLVVGAYSFGRRTLSWKTMLILVAAEAIAFGLSTATIVYGRQLI